MAKRKPAPKPKGITEEEFLGQVIDMAHLYGWKVAHFRPAKTAKGYRTPVQGDGKGFPDLIGTRRATKHKFVAELKVGRNKVTAEQNEWLTDCEACGIPAFTWTPGDWEEIEDTLKNGAV